MTTPARSVTAADLVPLLASALTRSSHEGARIVALHWLQQLEMAREQWRAALDESAVTADPADKRRGAVETLHRARVALRRLRATLREHGQTLALDEGARIGRALRRLNQITGPVRDRDVHREWLNAERDGLSEAARREAVALLNVFETDVVTGQRSVTRAFERHLDPQARKLARRLSGYCLPRTVGLDGQGVTFARHLADRVERGAAHLRQDLGMVSAPGAQRVLHRMRIRLKRQRAMLAPFARTHPALGAWYARATEGQDVLGAMRDAILLADRAHRRGYRALTRTLREVALAHFEAFHEAWCVDASASADLKDGAVLALRMLADERALHAAIASPVTGVMGLAAGHGLPMEIERKFLLHGLPPQAAMAPSVRIEQGWLPGTMLRERLRRSIAHNGDERLTRTIKLGQPGERIEVEEPTEPALFAALWPLTEGARIRKRRHAIRDGQLIWEIDVFLDRDLVLAEVELENVAQVVEIPVWLSPFIVREVTHDTAYLNSVMAQRDVASPDRGTH